MCVFSNQERSYSKQQQKKVLPRCALLKIVECDDIIISSHFYKILNANDYDHNLTADVCRKLQNVQHDSNMAVSAKSITEVVSKLECGRSAGPDGISAECFKFSNTKIHVLLSLL